METERVLISMYNEMVMFICYCFCCWWTCSVILCL